METFWNGCRQCWSRCHFVFGEYDTSQRDGRLIMRHTHPWNVFFVTPRILLLQRMAKENHEIMSNWKTSSRDEIAGAEICRGINGIWNIWIWYSCDLRIAIQFFKTITMIPLRRSRWTTWRTQRRASIVLRSRNTRASVQTMISAWTKGFLMESISFTLSDLSKSEVRKTQ